MATAEATTTISRPVQGALLATAAMSMFVAQDAVIKYFLEFYSVLTILFFRSVALAPFAAFLVWKNHGMAGFRTSRLGLQLIRGVLMFGMFFLFFLALRDLDLATAITLTLTAPLWTTLLSVPMLKERVGIHRLGAVLIGFAGVLFILRPGGDVFGLPALLCLAATFCYSLAMVLTRRLGVTESLTGMVFFQNAVFLVGAALFAPIGWTPVAPLHILVLMAIGVATIVPHLAITQAYRIAPPPIIAPFDYTTLVWGLLLGWLFFNELPSVGTIFGAAVIVVAGLYVIYRESRLTRLAKQPAVR